MKDNCDPYDERKYTIRMMEQYGVVNVRVFRIHVQLDKEEIESIKKQIWNA